MTKHRFDYKHIVENILKKFFIAAAIAATALATPAMAADFVGPRIEATVGVDDVTKLPERSDLNYGAAIGIDAPFLGDKLTIGVEANVDNVFAYRDWGAAARLGYKVSNRVLVYGKAGYADFRGLEGVRVGGGIDYALTDHLYAGVEYRYTDFEKNVGRHAGLVKIGVRF